MSLLSNQSRCPRKALRTMCAPSADTCPPGGAAAAARHEAKPKKPSKQTKAKAAPHVGLQAPVFVLHGFWLLANRRNHCYANSVLQNLHWVVPTAELPLLQEPKCASQLAHLTPEHPSLEPATRGWTFDGRQQDAAEFPTAILPNFSPLSLGAWETRSPLEGGYIVDEEGTSPVFLNVDMAADLQTMINSWSKDHAYMLCCPLQDSSASPCHDMQDMAKTVSQFSCKAPLHFLSMQALTPP